MPIYQYACRACGEEHEALQKISDKPLIECPHCGEPELVKQLTAAAFKLKGTGWYETDFKDSGKKPEEKPGKSEASDKGDKKAAGPGKSGSDGVAAASGGNKSAGSTASASGS